METLKNITEHIVEETYGEWAASEALECSSLHIDALLTDSEHYYDSLRNYVDINSPWSEMSHEDLGKVVEENKNLLNKIANQEAGALRDIYDIQVALDSLLAQTIYALCVGAAAKESPLVSLIKDSLLGEAVYSFETTYRPSA